MTRQKRYWLCQLIGWGALAALTFFISYYFGKGEFYSTETKKYLFIYAVVCAVASYILFTHLVRLVLLKIKWLSFPPGKTLLTLISGVILATVFSFYFTELIEKIPGKTYTQYVQNENKEKAIELEKELNIANTDYYLYETNKTFDSTKYKNFSKIKNATSWYRDKNNNWQKENHDSARMFGGLFNSFILISLWMLIYAVYHYVEKNRNNQLDKLRLEAVVKSLELKTIKSHINPHFIFNALNSIRALVDENPTRARTAITELSNILRSSLQAEKQETVTLEQELDIVKDYLALEQMRFEERLQVEFNIDENTLTQHVPPMMVQTLVENAIKHGVSKQEAGGIISIKSAMVNNQHEITIVNTGSLQERSFADATGFGIKGTQDRLNILYQHKAHFEIKDLNGNLVESKIILPKQ
jgi:two-component system, LytTR family, sensor kinase